MFLGRVQGHIVATAKDESVRGMKLLVIEPLKVVYDDAAHAAHARGPEGASSNGAITNGPGGRFEVTGRAIVAIDRIGAGEGQLVLITQGSSARLADGCNKVPTDAVVIGIVDEVRLLGKRISEAQSKMANG